MMKSHVPKEIKAIILWSHVGTVGYAGPYNTLRGVLKTMTSVYYPFNTPVMCDGNKRFKFYNDFKAPFGFIDLRNPTFKQYASSKFDSCNKRNSD